MAHNPYHKIIQKYNMWIRNIWVKWFHFYKQKEDTKKRQDIYDAL